MWPFTSHKSRQLKTARRARSSFRPRLDALEDRTAPAVFTVVNTLDDGSAGSLRWAVTQANADADPLSDINFNIPGTGAQTIALTAALPTITHPVVLDGYTQPGASPNTLPLGDNAVLKIVLDGTLAGAVDGLVIAGGNSTVRGLVIGNFAEGSGIVLNGSGKDLVVGNFIGADVTGDSAAANNIGIETNPPSQGNVIGGASPGDRNIISGNNSALPDAADGGGVPYDYGIYGGNGDQIEGNYIGTDKSGAFALPNGTGVGVDANNTIGGTAAGAGNVISGNNNNNNDGAGIVLFGNQNLVAGNLIGTTATGLAALGNAMGIGILGNNNIIGGTTAGARNIISGNLGWGVNISPVSSNSAQSNLVQGNYIGTDITGATALGQQVFGGITIAGAYNTIGGSTDSARNIISGNGGFGIAIYWIQFSINFAYANVVQDNYIGADPSGTQAVPNGQGGIWLFGGTTDNIIGGTLSGEGNLISGNGRGIRMESGSTGAPTNNVIQGNLIGTDKTGIVALGNGGYAGGIQIDGGNNNTIGGTASGAGNAIAFNVGNGVDVDSGAGNSIFGNSIFSNSGLGILLESRQQRQRQPGCPGIDRRRQLRGGHNDQRHAR